MIELMGYFLLGYLCIIVIPFAIGSIIEILAVLFVIVMGAGMAVVGVIATVVGLPVVLIKQKLDDRKRVKQYEKRYQDRLKKGR